MYSGNWEVTGMTRNKIFAKLRRKNKGQYGILAFCIFLSVLLLTAFALMYFGPTVQEFLPEGGDTRKLAILLLGATAVGCAIFTLYASILFFRYKSREYGIFLALGEQKKTLGTMLFKELALLTGAAAALGLLGAIPLSWLIWKLFESFLVSTEEMEYHFGIGGLLVGLVFAIILAILLGAAGRKFVKKTNVMDILRTQHQPEMVKKIPAWTFGAGMGMILGGLLLAMGLPRIFVHVFHVGPPSVLNLFYFLAVAGIYLVLLSIVGQNRKGKNRKKYYKNLVSVSLMRFSAKSTTRNMCVVVLLLFAGIFAVYYGLLYSDSAGYIDNGTTRDFVLHYPVQEKQVTKEEIRKLAGEYSVEIQDYTEGEGANLVITYKMTDYTEDNEYVTVTREKGKTAFFLRKNLSAAYGRRPWGGSRNL